MVLLPETAALKVIPDNPRSGVIYFEDWGLSDAQVGNLGIKAKRVVNGSDLLLELSVDENERAPDQVEINVRWPHTTTPVRLRLPFPAKGIRGFDRRGRELNSGERIAIQALLGTRLLILGVPDFSNIFLKLQAGQTDISRRYQIRCLEGSLSSEIRISDYRAEIEQLMTIDDDPDSTVQLTLELNGAKKFFLEIAPYEARLERDSTEIWINFEGDIQLIEQDTEFIKALAVRLENPGDEPLPLPKIVLADQGRIKWSLLPDEREPGSWLIHPSRDSTYFFRPTLWTVPGERTGENEYIEAISLQDETSRHAVLDAFILTLAADFLHPNWLEVEQLAGQIGHLPLETLDLWRRFARSSEGMAALALRFSNLPIHFLYRFAQELPFAWETVSFVNWRKAMDLGETQCKVLFGTDDFLAVFKNFLDSRRKDFSAEFGSLFYVLGILSSKYFDEGKKDADLIRAGGPFAADWLFKFADGPLMKLRRDHHADTEEWPQGFKELLSSSRHDSQASRYVFEESLGYQDEVINIPLILAAQSAFAKTEMWFADPAKIHLLRHFRAFDPDWFDEAFNQTIARCFADGLLD